jgi:SAM-dependent methyltransferase
MGNQSDYFDSSGGDEYFIRNQHRQSEAWELPGLSGEIIEWAQLQPVPGKICVVGGASGPEAGFLKSALMSWQVTNVDISQEAIRKGPDLFPEVIHICEGLDSESISESISEQDCILLAGIMCWIDRDSLARAIYNVAKMLKSGGLLAIYDFFPSNPKVNNFSHREGIFTYKQDYAKLFESAGPFRVIRYSVKLNSDINYDVEDRLHGFALLTKL